jgi:hypothetical protein
MSPGMASPRRCSSLVTPNGRRELMASFSRRLTVDRPAERLFALFGLSISNACYDNNVLQKFTAKISSEPAAYKARKTWFAHEEFSAISCVRWLKAV